MVHPDEKDVRVAIRKQHILANTRPYSNQWLVLVVVSTALFLISIDMTVLYTALPRLTHDLAAKQQPKALDRRHISACHGGPASNHGYAWRPDWASPSLSLGSDCFCLCLFARSVFPVCERPDRGTGLSCCGRIHDDAGDAFPPATDIHNRQRTRASDWHLGGRVFRWRRNRTADRWSFTQSFLVGLCLSDQRASRCIGTDLYSIHSARRKENPRATNSIS